MTKKQLPADVTSAPSGALMTEEQAESVAKLLIHGDLKPLSEKQRWDYCVSICNRLGIDPMTQPFQLLSLSGKLVLYATKSCTEQLSRKYHLSFHIQEAKRDGDLAICIGSVSTPVGNGRSVGATGVVSISGLKGDALANAIMKAETKAFRRATLRMCGLGMLDEVEIEAVPNDGTVLITKPGESAMHAALAKDAEAQAGGEESSAGTVEVQVDPIASKPADYEGDGGTVPTEPPEDDVDVQALYDDLVEYIDSKPADTPGTEGAGKLKVFAVAMGWEENAFNKMMKDRHQITARTFATAFTWDLMLAVANQIVDEAA